MSNPYGHSLSLLRQTSVILSEQLMSVNLYALRSDTVGGATDWTDVLKKKLSQLSATAPVTAVTQTWTTVLASVAVPLVKFGQEMARVQIDIKSQMDALRIAMRFTWIIEAIVILGFFFVLTRILSFVNMQKGAATSTATAGMLIVMMLFVVAGFRLCAASINDKFALISYQLKTALATTLLTYLNALPATQVMVVMYAIVTGSNVSAELARFNQSIADISLASKCSNEKGSISASTASGLPDCLDIPTMVTMPNWIADNVEISTLLTIADALIDLKELGVDRFDRAPLWTNVRAGVDAVRSLCMVAYDDTDPAREITRDVIANAIQHEIVPILCVPGVELTKGFYGPTKSAYSDATTDSVGNYIPPSIAGMTLLNPPSYSTFMDYSAPVTQKQKMSLSQCTRSIINSGGEYAFGYYDHANSRCYACSNVSTLTSSFTSNASLMAAAGNQLIVSRPNVIDGALDDASKGVSSSSGPTASSSNVVSSSSSSSGPTASSLYLSSLHVPWAMASTILDQSEDLQQRIIVVLKRYQYAIDLDKNRYLIDQGLEAFYGSGIYKTSGVSNAIDSLLADLKGSVIKYRTSGHHNSTSLYVDTDRMIEKIYSLSNDSTKVLSDMLQSLKDASASYVNLYAPFMSMFPQKFSDIVALFGGYAVFIVYGTYVTLQKLHFNREIISTETMYQRVIVATCILTVSLFVIESTMTQMALKSKHDQHIMNDNSMMLIGATVRINDEFSDLLSAIQTWKSPGGSGAPSSPPSSPPSLYNAPRAKAVAFLADCKGVIEKFDACNTITAEQARLPLPLTEILLFCIVGGGVLVVAAVFLNSIQPSERIQMIGKINRLITRITEGDSSAVLEAKTVVDCGGQPFDIVKWLTWLGIFIFTWVTVWFATQSINALNKFKMNLDSSDTC